MKKLVLYSLLAASLALMLIACGQSQKGSTLVYGATEKVTDMDTASAYDFHTWEIFQNIDQGLLTYKPGTTEIAPGLAESYTVNDKGDQYTFNLRKGLKFSNGDPFNAQAVKWSIDRVIALKGDPSWLVSSFVKSVDVVNDSTVRFNLVGPVATSLLSSRLPPISRSIRRTTPLTRL